MMEWHPIETAPKDGTQILVWGDPYSYDWAIFIVRYVQINKWSGWQTWDSADQEPTHWMPLPQPPSVPAGKDSDEVEHPHAYCEVFTNPDMEAAREIAAEYFSGFEQRRKDILQGRCDHRDVMIAYDGIQWARDNPPLTNVGETANG